MDYTLDGDTYTDLRNILKSTTSCWIATRLNGASASMACDGTIDLDLLHYLDKQYPQPNTQPKPPTNDTTTLHTTIRELGEIVHSNAQRLNKIEEHNAKRRHR